MSRMGMRKPVPNSNAVKQRPPVSNPFDSDSDSEANTKNPKSSSAPRADTKNPPAGHNEDDRRGTSSSSSYSGFASSKSRYQNDFRDSGGFENQSVQELENYAAYKSEETTQTVNNCLKIAEDIREDATKTLVTLHQQGEQITRTHMVAANIEQDLSRGEKLLGSLGGLFSKTWKPKKNRQIKGPALIKEDSFKRKGSHLEQRDKLGLNTNTKGRPQTREYSQPTAAMEKVEVEKAKQDDALSDISDILGQLKEMAVDMGTEIERQSAALDHLHEDVDELNFRVKGANQRGRRLLGK